MGVQAQEQQGPVAGGGSGRQRSRRSTRLKDEEHGVAPVPVANAVGGRGEEEGGHDELTLVDPARPVSKNAQHKTGQVSENNFGAKASGAI